MLDSAGKRVAEQGQLQFLAERRERLDIPDTTYAETAWPTPTKLGTVTQCGSRSCFRGLATPAKMGWTAASPDFRDP